MSVFRLEGKDIFIMDTVGHRSIVVDRDLGLFGFYVMEVLTNTGKIKPRKAVFK